MVQKVFQFPDNSFAYNPIKAVKVERFKTLFQETLLCARENYLQT
jgi:hypothetical protein